LYVDSLNEPNSDFLNVSGDGLLFVLQLDVFAGCAFKNEFDEDIMLEMMGV
jgi:hypothetical protein